MVKATGEDSVQCRWLVLCFVLTKIIFIAKRVHPHCQFCLHLCIEKMHAVNPIS